MSIKHIAAEVLAETKCLDTVLEIVGVRTLNLYCEILVRLIEKNPKWTNVEIVAAIRRLETQITFDE